jgi:hypothetical protein
MVSGLPSELRDVSGNKWRQGKIGTNPNRRRTCLKCKEAGSGGGREGRLFMPSGLVLSGSKQLATSRLMGRSRNLVALDSPHSLNF